MNHVQYLVSRANNPTDIAIQQRPEDVPNDGVNEHISGHALMASCPPPNPIEPIFRNSLRYELPDIDKASLAKLLGLSEKLPGLAEEELPPIRAWPELREDSRFRRLNFEDFQNLQANLIHSIQCHR